MSSYVTYGPNELQHVMSEIEDLDAVIRAVARERAIRDTAAETGEPREIVAEALDAAISMDHEAVLDLTEGQPTTLREALARYLDRLEKDIDAGDAAGPVTISADLNALLAYPWSEEEATISTHGENASVRLEVEHPDDDHVVIRLGGQQILSASYEDLVRGGVTWLKECARAVHRALLVRVTGDREHLVQINDRERRALLEFAACPGGSWHPEGNQEAARRLSVDAVQGGGLLIRTRPYRYVPPVRTRD
jgi:hypothetical protein